MDKHVRKGHYAADGGGGGGGGGPYLSPFPPPSLFTSALNL